jgi:hypothetical protein
LSGTFNGWSHKIPMHQSGNDFSHIISLPPGEHAYKFIVDNEWRFASDQPTIADKQGNINNYVDLANFKPDEFLIKSRSALQSWDAPPPLPPRRARHRRRRAKRKQDLAAANRIQRDESSSSSTHGAIDGGQTSSDATSPSSEATGRSDSGSDTVLALPSRGPQHGEGGLSLPSTGPSSQAAPQRRRKRHTAIGLAERVPVYDPDRPGGMSSDSEDDNDVPYGTQVPSEDKYTKEPPGIAAHLRAMPLNHDFPATPTGHKLLPIPSHVGVGHLFCTAVKGDLTVHGITTRYKRKFTTMVFYSPQTVRGADVVKVAREGGLQAEVAPRKGSASSGGAAPSPSTAATAPAPPTGGSGALQPPLPQGAGQAGATLHSGSGTGVTGGGGVAGGGDTHVVVQTTSGPLTVRLTAAHRAAIEEQRATAQQRLATHRELLRSEVAAGRLSRQQAEEVAQQAQAQAEDWLGQAQNQVLQAALIAQYAAAGQQPAGTAAGTAAGSGSGAEG